MRRWPTARHLIRVNLGQSTRSDAIRFAAAPAAGHRHESPRFGGLFSSSPNPIGRAGFDELVREWLRLAEQSRLDRDPAAAADPTKRNPRQNRTGS